jgi:tetratricopeptide (TPR) repeat protein
LALDRYKQALEIDLKIGTLRAAADTRWSIARLLMKIGRRDEALSYAGLSLAYFESTNDPDAEEARNILAEWRIAAKSGNPANR